MSAKAFKINGYVGNAQDTLDSTVHATYDSLSNLFEAIDECITQARDLYWERSEAWQDSGAGQAADEWISDWDTYRDSVESAMMALDDIIGQSPSETAADY